MGMSDKQYDGMLLDIIEDWEQAIEIADALPDSPEKDRLLKFLNKQKMKTERKLETPVTP